VTADGGINCVDNPGEQEEISAQLLLCEVVTALLLLRAEGTLILKTFTTLEHKTLCLMYLLACCFAEVTLKQPVLFTSAWYTVVYCLHLQHTPASNPSNEVNYPLPLSDYSHPPLPAVTCSQTCHQQSRQLRAVCDLPGLQWSPYALKEINGKVETSFR